MVFPYRFRIVNGGCYSKANIRSQSMQSLSANGSVRAGNLNFANDIRFSTEKMSNGVPVERRIQATAPIGQRAPHRLVENVTTW